MLVLTANIFKQRKMWKQVKSKVIIDVLLMTQEMKVIILQENSAAGNRGQIMVTWSVSKQGDRPMLSCPVLMMMMNTWQTTAPVTCICHYRGSPGHWPAATGDWVTRLHNIIIISAATLHLSTSSTPGQGCFVQAGADLSIVVNCSNSLFFVHLKYCAGHQRGRERGDDGKMFTDKIQIKYLHHSLAVTSDNLLLKPSQSKLSTLRTRHEPTKL